MKLWKLYPYNENNTLMFETANSFFIIFLDLAHQDDQQLTCYWS